MRLFLQGGYPNYRAPNSFFPRVHETRIHSRGHRDPIVAKLAETTAALERRLARVVDPRRD